MINTDGHPRLEQLLRDELRAEATRLFPDHAALPATPTNRHSTPRNWWPALAAAAVVAALAIGISVVAYAPRHTPSGTTPTGTTPTSTARYGYPEASTLPGVQVVTATARQEAIGGIQFANTFPPKATLILGETYPFTAEVTDAIPMTSPAPYVLTITTVTTGGAALHCPPPFLIRNGYTYTIRCSITPRRRTDHVLIALTTTSGQPFASASQPFNAR